MAVYERRGLINKLITITAEEFLEALKDLPKDWEKSSQKCRIRIMTGGDKFPELGLCPITAVYYHKTGKYVSAGNFQFAADRLNLCKAFDIVRASDRTHFEYRDDLKFLREKMLEALS